MRRTHSSEVTDKIYLLPIFSGSATAPKVTLEVYEWDGGAARRLLAAPLGITVHTTAAFDKGQGAAASALAKILQTAPQTIFPVR